MQSLRTPDERFADLDGYPFAPNYVDIDDTEGGTLRGDKALAPVVTVRDGEVFTADWGPRPWGWLPDTA